MLNDDDEQDLRNELEETEKELKEAREKIKNYAGHFSNTDKFLITRIEKIEKECVELRAELANCFVRPQDQPSHLLTDLQEIEKLEKELKEAHAKLARVLTDNTTLRSRLSVMREDLEYCIRMLERVSFKEKAVSEK